MMVFRGATNVRDRRILSGVRDGLTNAEIAAEIGLKPDTVRTYVTTLYQRFGARSRAALVVAAIESGIIEPYKKKTRLA